jgi:hypothetical protein
MDILIVGVPGGEGQGEDQQGEWKMKRAVICRLTTFTVCIDPLQWVWFYAFGCFAVA